MRIQFFSLKMSRHVRVTSTRDGRILTVLIFGILVFLMHSSDILLHEAYRAHISQKIVDRNGFLLEEKLNVSGAYMTEMSPAPRLSELLLRAEDRYFYVHPGVNPVSAVRALARRVLFGEQAGGSTITQQLVKKLLGHENERTLTNKIGEVWYALSLELFTSKAEILRMYMNSAYLGNSREGVEEASRYYFGKTANELSDADIARLLPLFSMPSASPGSANNTRRAKALAGRLGLSDIGVYTPPPKEIRAPKKDPALFEAEDLTSCEETCALTIDRELTTTIRKILRDTLLGDNYETARNGAVAVVRVGVPGEPNTLLALVGSVDPYGRSSGDQINMALTPRPIGSTWKPFIYARAIEKGARPYTIIHDLEYRYDIGTGFAFYPKNYDGIYRGPVTLHYALSNSLNVPAVRALEFVTLPGFEQFMEHELGFLPHQALDSYQLSIALGGLEMNPLLLAEYFSVFPRGGTLAPLAVRPGKYVEIPMMRPEGLPRIVLTATTTALLSAMLSDRLMGVEQFGLESNLNLPFGHYAVKTGTTYDYHDSWTVGYTQDVVVVVWIGNADNKAMDALSGARGAGKIWHDVMNLLYAKGEITPREFSRDGMVTIDTPEGKSLALSGDAYETARTIMIGEEEILEPHNGDVLEYSPRMSVPLRARSPRVFRVNGVFLAEGTLVFWKPDGPGTYEIEATGSGGGGKEILTVRVVADPQRVR